MLKFAVPIIIIFIAAIAWIFAVYFLTIRLDFSKVFKSDAAKPPQQGQGLSVRFRGIDGDYLDYGMQFSTTSDSEAIELAGKNLVEARSGLSKIETSQLEAITNLPTTFFKFNLYIESYKNSPNNSKSESRFLVDMPAGNTAEILPGQTYLYSSGKTIDELMAQLPQMRIRLVYRSMPGFPNIVSYMNFYDKNGNLISQATGEIVVTPTPTVQLFIFLGIWAFIVALLILIKQTLLSGEDLQQTLDYFGTR